MVTITVYIIKLDLSGYFELARRHYVYTFNTTSTVTVTNDTKDIKLKLLGDV